MKQDLIISDENYTPSYFVDRVRVFSKGFDLDPFSCDEANKIVKAKLYLDKHQDGLLQPWRALCTPSYPVIWVNPPYSRSLIRKCVAKTMQYINYCEIFLLVNSSTCSIAYQSAFNHADAILFPRKRINFINPYKPNKHGNEYDQTLFYYGHKPNEFVHHMNDLAIGRPISIPS